MPIHTMHRASIRRSVLMAAAAGTAVVLSAAPAAGQNYDQFRSRTNITFSGTVRNFTPSTMAGGHPDFVRLAPGGAGRYARVTANLLDGDNKPAYSSTGYRVLEDWRDGMSRAIISTKPYIQSRPGDTAGSHAGTQGGVCTTAAAFSQWFRDVPGVNTVSRASMTMNYNAGTGAYIFDGSLDTTLFNNADYSYSYEVELPFVYESGRNWYFSTATNADVWIYVDDRLVIDGGSGTGYNTSFAVDDTLTVQDTARISGPNGTPITLSTNSTANGAFQVNNNARIIGDALSGPGSDPTRVIQTQRGNSLSGTRGTLQSTVPMNSVPAPTDLGASVGNRIYTGGSHVIGSSFRCGEFIMQNQSVIEIQGEVTIYADVRFRLINQARILLAPGATLTVFSPDFFLQDGIHVNANTEDPSRVLFVNLGTNALTLIDGVRFFGNIMSPNGHVIIGDNVIVTGVVMSRSALVHNTGQFIGVGTVGDLLAGLGAVNMTQRIEVDRLGWLSEGRTHQLRVYFANRRGALSFFRLETNLDLLNIAAVPMITRVDHD